MFKVITLAALLLCVLPSEVVPTHINNMMEVTGAIQQEVVDYHNRVRTEVIGSIWF